MFQESKVKFHVIGLKCQECGSYNTCRTAGPDESSDRETNGAPSQNGPDQGPDVPPEGATGGPV